MKRDLQAVERVVGWEVQADWRAPAAQLEVVDRSLISHCFRRMKFEGNHVVYSRAT